MNNIGGFGLTILMRASITFPAGFTITQFADDADPFDIPSIQIRDKGMGLNGDLVSWGKAQPVNIKISVIPDSADDINLAILLRTNKVGAGRNPVTDTINLVGTYPDGNIIVLNNGVITDGPPASGVASSGRMKSKEYSFSFENMV
jgi:hypothetical protein